MCISFTRMMVLTIIVSSFFASAASSSSITTIVVNIARIIIVIIDAIAKAVGIVAVVIANGVCNMQNDDSSMNECRTKKNVSAAGLTMSVDKVGQIQIQFSHGNIDVIGIYT